MCVRCGVPSCNCPISDEAYIVTSCDGVPSTSVDSPIANGNTCDVPQKVCAPMNVTRPPYYCAAPGIQEHSSPCPLNVYGGLRVLTSFNIPDCQGSSVVQLEGVTQLLIGSFFWNPNYGYLKVKDFNVLTQQVILENGCESGNAPEGTQVLSCTIFVVTDGPNSTSTSLANITPFLASDFIAPANGQPQTIGVTNVNGLAVGKNITLAGGTYTLEEIINSTTIVIRNNGLGVVPNTQVFARNVALELQYPITLIDVNNCTNAPVSSGVLMVCKNNIQQPLDAIAVGSVPVVINATTNEIQYQILQVPTRTCTALTAAATLAPGNPAAILTVQDTSIFTVGNVLQLGTRTDRFTIGTILDATHLSGNFSPTPGAVGNIPVGTSVCTIDCCEDNAANIGANRSASGTITSDAFTPVAINQADAQVAEGFDSDVIIVNDSPSKVMRVTVQTVFVLKFNVTGVAGQYYKFEHAPRVGFGVGPIGTVPVPTLGDTVLLDDQVIIAATQTTAKKGDSFTYARTFQINVGEEMRYKARNRLISKGGNIGTGLGLDDCFAETSVLSVAVQV